MVSHRALILFFCLGCATPSTTGRLIDEREVEALFSLCKAHFCSRGSWPESSADLAAFAASTATDPRVDLQVLDGARFNSLEDGRLELRLDPQHVRFRPESSYGGPRGSALELLFITRPECAS